MPTDHIVWGLLRITGVSGMSIGGVFFAAANLSGDPDFDKWIVAIRELTSFAIIGILVLGAAYLLYQIVPIISKFLTDLTNRHLDELRLEREARERSLVDFREMLHAHSDKVAEKIEEQTHTLQALCKEVSGRPCQLPQFKNIQ
jgi:hypothetical protein